MGAELAATLIEGILKLTNRSDIMFDFQWGKTQRCGADHLLTIPYDDVRVRLPIRVQLVAVGSRVGWDMTICSWTFSLGATGEPRRGSMPVTTEKMSAALKRYAKVAGESQKFTLHFSVRGSTALTRALAGAPLSTITQIAYWKNPKKAWWNMLEVAAPGSEGATAAGGIVDNQYRQLNEFPLDEQS